MSNEVLIWPDKRLRGIAATVTEFDEATADLANLLSTSMHSFGGIGLAAPQLGISKQMFVIDGELFPANLHEKVAWMSGNVIFTNPIIAWQSEETNTDMEGCLSFPDVFVPVVRPNKVKVMHTGLTGLIHLVEVEGLLARCILHENDHINGRLLVDNVGPLKKSMIKKRMLRRKSR